jgi:predicted alpha/beta hydrolase family esterase
MKKVILIHGYTSSPNKKKYQIISQELDKLGVEYSIPALPGGEHPHSNEWLEIIDKEVNNAAKPVVLVGHSLGTRAALLYLDKFERKVDTVILIAAFNNNFEENRNRKDEYYADFFGYALDIEKIKKLANEFIVVHSKDDDSIDYKQGVEISNELGAELITYEDKGHFCGEERAEENAAQFLKVIKSVL